MCGGVTVGWTGRKALSRANSWGAALSPATPEEVDLVPEFSSDEAVPLDATVGGFEGVRKEDALAEDPAALHVAVSGDGVSDADTMGLADDVSALIQAFVRDRAPIDREAPPDAPTPDSDPDQKLHIALHGLNLSREDERAVHRLIRDLVRERRAPGGTER